MNLLSCLAQISPMNPSQLWSSPSKPMNLLAHAASWFTTAALWPRKLKASQFALTALKQS